MSEQAAQLKQRTYRFGLDVIELAKTFSEVYERPVPGMPIVRRTPAVPAVTLNPLGQTVSEALRRPKFHRIPGAILILRRNRHPISPILYV